MRQPPLIVVMGVSGSGKSFIGVKLARDLGLPFVDADDLHPAANVEKMASGVPLDDEDRRPWLEVVGLRLAAASTGLVIACSALKRSYREAILATAPGAVFVHLDGPRELLAERIGGRTDHFMPTTLLDSQLATLEPLEPDEPGFAVSIATDADTIVALIADRLSD